MLCKQAAHLQEAAPGEALVQSQEFGDLRLLSGEISSLDGGVLVERRKLGVQVGGEPVRRLQVLQQAHGWRAAQRPVVDLQVTPKPPSLTCKVCSRYLKPAHSLGRGPGIHPQSAG